MNSTDKVKAIGLCLFFGGLLLYRSIRRHRMIRRAVDTPRSKTASAPQGFVELEGFAWPDTDTVISCSGNEALYHSFQLQREVTRGSGKSRRRTWETVFQRIHAAPFYIVDGTGLVMLDPAAAELNLETASARSWRSLNMNEKRRVTETLVTSAVAQFPPEDIFFGFFGPKFRIVESEIRVGSPMYATGNFSAAEGETFHVKSKGLTYFFNHVFDIKTGGLKSWKKVFDTDDDGRVDAGEAQHGYSALAQRGRSKEKAQNPTESEFRLHGTLGSSSIHRLFVADTNQTHLTERLGRFLWTQFIGGAALLTAGIALTFGLLRDQHQPSGNQRAPNSAAPIGNPLSVKESSTPNAK